MAKTIPPKAALTPFEGLPVLASAIEIPGAGGGLRDAMQVDPVELHFGQEVFVVIRGTVAKVGHEGIKDADAFRRVHVLRVEEAAIVDRSLVEAHMQAQAAKIKEAKAAAEGNVVLPGMGVTGDDKSDEAWEASAKKPAAKPAKKAAAKKAAAPKGAAKKAAPKEGTVTHLPTPPAPPAADAEPEAF